MMIRKQVYLDSRQEAFLKRLSREMGVTEAEVIRQAIDRQAQTVLVSHRDLAAWRNEKSFIMKLIAQGPVAGGRTWHREDLHER